MKNKVNPDYRSISATTCTQWNFERLQPGDSTVVFETPENSTQITATVTCASGFAFHRLTSDTEELTSLMYECTEGNEFTNTDFTFGTYVPQCVREFCSPPFPFIVHLKNNNGAF